MTFTILATLEVASLVVLAVSLHGSVRAVYERDKLRKQTPLTLLSRYRALYRRVASPPYGAATRWGRWFSQTLGGFRFTWVSAATKRHRG